MLPSVEVAMAQEQQHDADGNSFPDRLSAAPASILTGPYVPEGPQPGKPPAEPSAAAGRNLLFDEIGRGGMGAVFQGRDTELGRELAVKVLLEEHRDRPELVRRFLEEAQIAGQLQHPGVAPVYELGRFADNRPFFTMKLVKGHTLAELLRQRADVHQDLGQFLGIFAQVCQTVAYAHSRGVLHRDLKPSNVMVGRFGEVQVMDWGLAKLLHPDPAEEAKKSGEDVGSVIQMTRPGSTGEASRTGTVVGTPSYMAPEQARGEVGAVDERADVFGLGAILCVILTGQPPFRADNGAVLRTSEQGDLGEAFARLAGCGADVELVRLCQECLAAARQERPRHAGVVAERVAAYQAAVQERLRRAEVERAAATAKAQEERKRRRVTVALAAAVLGLMLLGGGGGFYLQQQAVAQREEAIRREVEERQAVETGLRQVAQLRGQLRWKEARVALEQTRARLSETGPDDLRQRLQRELATLNLVDQLDALRLKSISHLGAKADLASVAHDFASLDREYAQTFQQAGIATEGEDPLVVAERVRSSGVAGQLLAALDAWASKARDEGRQTWLLAVARQVDPHAQRGRLRDPQAWKDPVLLKERVEEAKVEELTPPLTVALAVRLTARGAGRERWLTAVRMLTAAQRQHPTDFWLAFTLGFVLERGGQRDEAASYYRVALALRPETARLWFDLGRALQDRGQLDEAIAHYHKALHLDPRDPWSHYNLGRALQDRGRLDEAVAHLQEVLALAPKTVAAHHALGTALAQKQQVNEAIAHFRQAIALDPRYAPAHYNLGILTAAERVDEAIAHFRKAITHDPHHAAAHFHLGDALKEKGQVDKAIECYQKALAINPQLAGAHFHLGNTLADRGQMDEAITHYQKAAILDPKDARVHNNLGNVLLARGWVDEAITHYQTAIKLDPGNARRHCNLGNALLKKDRWDEAMTHYRKAIALDPQLATAHFYLADVLEKRERVDEAITHYQKVVVLDPKYAAAHTRLGIILLGRGQAKGAIEHFQKVTDLDPKEAGAHTNLGNALHGNGQVDEAIAQYHKAIALDPQLVLAHYNLGVALVTKGQLDKALTHYQKAIDLDPKFVPAYGNLGSTLLRLGRFAEARDATCQSLDLLPKSSPSRPRTLKQLQQCEELVALDQKLAAVLKGDAQPADATERLQFAGLCARFKKHYAGAARFYAQALEAVPALARDLDKGFRYDAACCAALAAAGKGEDAGGLDDKERARLRRQARDWLAADLALWSEQAGNKDVRVRELVRKKLRDWQTEADLAGLREPEALANLPEAERESWRKLWEAVQAVRKKAGGGL
jgi:tetratricopeptide (TPR) repeat protein